MVMGIVFDIYNTVTSVSRWLRWLRPTLDITFWISSAAFVYAAVFYLDNGRLRLYTFVLVFAGYVVYKSTLHPHVVGSAFAIMRAIEAVIRAVYRVVYTFTVRPMLAVLRVGAALTRFLYRVLCVLEDWVFWILGFWCRLMMLPRLFHLSWIQWIWIRIWNRWEDICRVTSKWLKTKTERV